MNAKVLRLIRVVFVAALLLNGVAGARAQVDLPSGDANYTLPVFHWLDDKSRLSLPIALNYTSGSGLKVNSIASNVGQGWELQLGGAVSRMQVGEPDDQIAYGMDDPGDVTKYPNGYLYNSIDIALGCPRLLPKYPIFGGKNKLYKQHNPVVADKELDHFAFQFNGRGGVMVLQKGGTAIFLSDTKMKAWYTTANMTGNQIRTTIDAFYIQDENGLIYKFATREIAKELKSKFCDNNEIAAKSQPDMKGQHVYNQSSFDDNDPSNPLTKPLVNPWVVTSWYLTTITDPLTSRVVTFNYLDGVNAPTINNGAGFAFSYYANKDYDIITHTISITRTPQLQSVDFPDHHRVELKYGDMRVDLSGDQILSKIDVLFNGRYISEHQLTTSYFIQNRYGTPNSPFQKQCARLCLQAVRRLGVDLKDEEPPYQFDYYLGSSAPYDFVPPPYYYMKDIWGYYNGDYSVDASNNPIAPTTAAAKLNFQQVKGLCYMRNNDVNAHLYTAKAGYAKNGLLKNIFYPAGGKLTYYYDQNMAMVNGQSVAVGGVHVSKTQVSDGGFSNGCGNPLETNYNYYTDFTHAQSSLLVSQTPWNSMATPTNSYDPDGWYPYFRLPFHVGCDYHFKYPGILQLEQAVSLTANQQFWQAFFKVVDVVGAVMDVMDVVNVCLDATPAAIIAVVMDVIGVVFEFVFTCTADLHRENAETIVYSSDVNAANPLPACYTRLEVTEGSGTDGTTVYEFTSPADYPVWIPDNGDHTYNTTWAKYTMEQRFPYWAYGQIKKVTQVDPSNNKIKETENVFDPSFLREEYIDLSKQHFGDVNPQSCKCDLVKENSMRNDNWSDPTNFDPATTYVTGYDADNGIRPFFYGYYHGRLPLATTYERTFKPGDPSHWQQTETDYLYNTKNFQPSMITTTQSNGDQSEKQLTYTVDYNNNSSTILYSMAQNYNMVNDEVSSSMWVYKPSIHTAYLLDEKVTEFMTVATGAIKPARTMEQRFSQPQTSAALYNGPGSSSNPTYKQTAAFSYDGSGNVTGVVDEAGRVATNIYDYYDKFVTASAVNADAVQDKVAYTSFETSSLGGWTLSSGAPVGGTAVTGSQYLPLAGGSLTANINSSKPYILSFWATGTGVTATGTLVKSAPTINGYTYFEYSIAQGVSSVAVTGNGNIDELRLYPKMSRMRSSTYDPLVGKTAECDENNRITYFEYDGVGRLRLVKDESGNILKMFEYNYANNNQASCTVTYYNNAISEQFVKQNCSGSTIGKPYTYTIPQNKYSSTLSQAAADQQAQAELDDLGQSTADAQVVSNYCQAIWWNDPQSAPFTPDICPEGYKGTPVTYSVPGHRYSSLISLDDANQQALDEIQANGWAYANNMPSICMVDTAGDWIGDVTTQHCLSNGDKTMVYTDNNPNSPSYGHTQTIDMGADSSCPITPPPPPTVYAKLFFENTGGVTGGTDEYQTADIVVRFFSDQACTLPLDVSNVDVTVSVGESCDDGYNVNYNLSSYGVQGNAVTLATNQYLERKTEASNANGQIYDDWCYWTYSLNSSLQYTIGY